MAYIALKNLPLTIVSPIRSTSPVWVLFGAVIFFQEKISYWQLCGIIMTIIFLWIFSIIGKRENINFYKNKWVWAIVGATIIGSISSLYDKYIILRIDRFAVQVWFSLYMTILLAPFFYFYIQKYKQKVYWNWLIPLIGIFLAVADFFYFYSISLDDSLISIIGLLRRSNVIVSFILAGIILKEKNLKKKSLALLGMLIGLTIIILSSYY